jgi:hypothetical protein
MTNIIDPKAADPAADRKLRRATLCVRVVLSVALCSVALWFEWRSVAALIAAAQTPFVLAIERIVCVVMGVLTLLTVVAVSDLLAELAVIGATTWLSAQSRAALISRLKAAFTGYMALPQTERRAPNWTLLGQWLATSATAAVMIWVFSGEIKMLITMLPPRPTAHSLLLLIQIGITAFAMMKSAPLAIAFVDTASRRFTQAAHARNDRGTVK